MIAISAVQAACKVCQSIRSSDACEDAISKKDRSPVTIADFGSQAVIIQRLLENDSDLKMVAEEDANQMQSLKDTSLGTDMVNAVAEVVPGATWEKIAKWVSCGAYEGSASEAFWTLDPIDGTKGFLRNQQYAVALGLIENGEPVLGVLGCPNYPVNGFESKGGAIGRLFFAEKGKGAWTLPLTVSIDDSASVQPVRVSSIESAVDAKLCESVESGHSSHDDSAKLIQALEITKESLRMDSQCKYAAVANGDASIYLRFPTSAEYREKIWDHAAGVIVNTEAGGKVTDIHGNALDFSLGQKLEKNQGIIAAPASIHDSVVAAI